MKKLGENPTEDDLLTLVNKFDEDGNGTIEFSEFLVMMITKVARRRRHFPGIYNFIDCRQRKQRLRNQRISFLVALEP